MGEEVGREVEGDEGRKRRELFKGDYLAVSQH
jgi:hypothetical protein